MLLGPCVFLCGSLPTHTPMVPLSLTGPRGNNRFETAFSLFLIISYETAVLPLLLNL